MFRVPKPKPKPPIFSFLTIPVLLLLHYARYAQSLSSSSSAANPSNPIGVTRNIATQTLQGAGVPLVDLNQYNIDKTLVPDLLSAELVLKNNENAVFPRLATKEPETTYLDSVQVLLDDLEKFKFSLGLELLELQGGNREDNLGITIVQGIVSGGLCDDTIGDGDDIKNLNERVQVGDSLVSVSTITTTRNMASVSETGDGATRSLPNNESVQEETVSLECLDYDATVKALQSLFSRLPTSNNRKSASASAISTTTTSCRIVLKRLRRKPKVKVQVEFPPDYFENDDDDDDGGNSKNNKNRKDTTMTLEMDCGENLRLGLLRRNVPLHDALAQRYDGKSAGSGNCGAGGLCRTCMVSIVKDSGSSTSSSSLLNPQRPAEAQMLRDDPMNYRLACKAIVGYGMQEGTLKVRLYPRQW